MANNICIYHGGCDDGFGAAYAVRHATGTAYEFYPGIYDRPPPDVSDRHVLMVDFSYKRLVLEEMAKSARSITILDHHKTAATDLALLPKPLPFSEWEGYSTPAECVSGHGGIRALFDMERSGAGLAWDFFHAGQRPDFINYIEDRDLWRKQLPGSDEFTIALRSYPQTFEAWDQLFPGRHRHAVDRLRAEGVVIQRYYLLRVEEAKATAYATRIAARDCWIANAPYFMASEVAGELCSKPDAEFGACYFEVRPGVWQYSLRSRNDFDVSDIARAFGGSGHKGAARFTVTGAPIHYGHRA